jgi:RNA-binding protein
MTLNGSQKKKLKAMAHSLRPVVMIGQRGLTKEVLLELDHSLERQELIKVRFLEFKSEKDAICEQIQNQLSSELVTIIGHVAVFYRKNPDPDKRKIHF